MNKKKFMEEFVTKGFTIKQMEELCCPNGSFTCGLIRALKLDGRCNLCKRETNSETQAQSKSQDEEIGKGKTITVVSAKVIKNVDDFKKAITKKS